MQKKHIMHMYMHMPCSVNLLYARCVCFKLIIPREQEWVYGEGGKKM